MKKFIIKGPNKAIKGEINISGAKNSCLPLMAASILFKNKVTFKNIPVVKNIMLIICPRVRLKIRYPICKSGSLKNSKINLKIE